MRFSLLLAFAAVLLLAGCEKNSNKGLVQFTMNYTGASVTGVVIYVKSGTLTDPQTSPGNYDLEIRADSMGEYWYNAVEPGSYFFLVKGKAQDKQVTGSKSLQVRERNTYRLSIDLQ
ncbi:hypothetical protein [Deminuibacter soli]|uniref:Carboxypeptidase regulatory-like domain-containing protein n=1 Tax=Deminuibacter soli TaxID=2291815 RepID=A0A3E1NL44_9BACT|nr:hypothetical protein [Deminuibacter soli]RFM28508.1 hypothetical protein DXN05_06790 [Deminuibacter soli]